MYIEVDFKPPQELLENKDLVIEGSVNIEATDVQNKKANLVFPLTGIWQSPSLSIKESKDISLDAGKDYVFDSLVKITGNIRDISLKDSTKATLTNRLNLAQNISILPSDSTYSTVLIESKGYIFVLRMDNSGFFELSLIKTSDNSIEFKSKPLPLSG